MISFVLEVVEASGNLDDFTGPIDGHQIYSQLESTKSTQEDNASAAIELKQKEENHIQIPIEDHQVPLSNDNREEELNEDLDDDNTKEITPAQRLIKRLMTSSLGMNILTRYKFDGLTYIRKYP
jgi:hypothetical protein